MTAHSASACSHGVDLGGICLTCGPRLPKRRLLTLARHPQSGRVLDHYNHDADETCMACGRCYRRGGIDYISPDCEDCMGSGCATTGALEEQAREDENEKARTLESLKRGEER